MFGPFTMFNKSQKPKSSKNPDPHNGSKGPMAWNVPIFFGIMFALSIAEMIFTIDSFQYLQKKHKWWSGTERARLAFLIFSAARTILLSAVYVGFHCAVKHLHNMLHTIFLVISTILWIVSGILIHQMWGYVECENEGIANSFEEFKSQVSGGLSECHEIKIIEIIAWAIAGVSVLATIPVVITALKKRKANKTRGHNEKTAAHSTNV
ncbi:hypothetical protein TruAng_012342 [Truncatella angustata]|nr:hypothetical protein TruAng_012342 [Truncatella angustata]